jgi:hypothetical protein
MASFLGLFIHALVSPFKSQVRLTTKIVFVRNPAGGGVGDEAVAQSAIPSSRTAVKERPSTGWRRSATLCGVRRVPPLLFRVALW